MVNRLTRLAQSEYIIIWDADVVVNAVQILESTSAIKTGKYSMALPYDGRAVEVGKDMSRLFRKCLSLDFLGKLLLSYELIHGFHMSGGIYIVRKEFFLNNGGENENILGSGLEDAERLKRMEASGLPVFRSEGVLFYLFHPRSHRFVNRDNETRNRLEFIKTCESC
jgi:predicted glycosyltransferase involved in capsule biosynthesis